MERASRSGRFAPAHSVLFPLAALHAAVAVPPWTAQWLGWLPGGDRAGHLHEMLLGYAAAVVGGFLLTRLSWTRLAFVVAAWLAGRAVALAGAEGLPAAVAALSYPAVLAVLAGLPFLRGAKSGHNLVFFPILGGLLAAESLYLAGLAERGTWLAFDLIVLLVLVMGGRLLPAAMAGALRARGETLADRNRPGLERLGMAGMAAAAVLHLAGAPDAATLGWAVAGLAGLSRLARWRPWAALAQPMLWPLHLGYAWLCLGLIATAAATWTGAWPASAVLHAAAIGGLGTVTAVMMVRTRVLRDRLPPPGGGAMPALAALLSLAAALRMLAPAAPQPLTAAAAAAWTAAFAVVAMMLLSPPPGR